jgi:hypothetical protein
MVPEGHQDAYFAVGSRGSSYDQPNGGAWKFGLETAHDRDGGILLRSDAEQDFKSPIVLLNMGAEGGFGIGIETTEGFEDGDGWRRVGEGRVAFRSATEQEEQGGHKGEQLVSGRKKEKEEQARLMGEQQHATQN